MATLTIEVDSIRVQHLLKRLSNECSISGIADTLKEIGGDLVYSTKQRFITGKAPDGTTWQGLSDVTKNLRARRGRFGTRPLDDTGTMKTNVSYRLTEDGLVVGVNRRFGPHADAGVHQTGTDRAGRGHKVTIPARPFLGLSETDINGIEITIVRAIQGNTP
ncbi:MAG: phage virion morphogenesis protein [Azoarcus sp.]|jgi:phage virion morphogenesis protein|nr:phage virion morphogenesis protein [Azoarcus sp.]